MLIKRGEIYYADLSPVVGSEQGGVRPVLIVQNDVGNKFSPTLLPLLLHRKRIKMHFQRILRLMQAIADLQRTAFVLLEQVRTIDKRRLKEKMGSLDNTDMGKVDHALTVSFGL